MKRIMMILTVVGSTTLMMSCSEQTSPIEELEIKEVPATGNGHDNPAYTPWDKKKSN